MEGQLLLCIILVHCPRKSKKCTLEVTMLCFIHFSFWTNW